MQVGLFFLLRGQLRFQEADIVRRECQSCARRWISLVELPSGGLEHLPDSAAGLVYVPYLSCSNSHYALLSEYVDAPSTFLPMQPMPIEHVYSSSFSDPFGSRPTSLEERSKQDYEIWESAYGDRNARGLFLGTIINTTPLVGTRSTYQSLVEWRAEVPRAHNRILVTPNTPIAVTEMIEQVPQVFKGHDECIYCFTKRMMTKGTRLGDICFLADGELSTRLDTPFSATTVSQTPYDEEYRSRYGGWYRLRIGLHEDDWDKQREPLTIVRRKQVISVLSNGTMPRRVKLTFAHDDTVELDLCRMDILLSPDFSGYPEIKTVGNMRELMGSESPF